MFPNSSDSTGAVSASPHLIGLNDTLAGKKIALNPGKTRVGRDPVQCLIVLPQSFISRAQAEFSVEANGAVVLANLSRHGTTFVNGSPITAQKLNDGDRIDFGAGQLVSFTFRESLGAAGAAVRNSPRFRVFRFRVLLISTRRPRRFIRCRISSISSSSRKTPRPFCVSLRRRK
ncbi:MAG: FHA domain-containing protein [Acidobacteriota bacterium]|nr:FHA domain-containing protein [Acidobacteriota bacterium]